MAALVASQDLPSVYEYFADTPEPTGLVAGNKEFRFVNVNDRQRRKLQNIRVFRSHEC